MDAEEDLICEREHMGSEGMATEYFVRLPDGYLASCGSDKHRANILAKAIWLAAIPAEQWSHQIPF